MREFESTAALVRIRGGCVQLRINKGRCSKRLDLPCLLIPYMCICIWVHTCVYCVHMNMHFYVFVHVCVGDRVSCSCSVHVWPWASGILLSLHLLMDTAISCFAWVLKTETQVLAFVQEALFLRDSFRALVALNSCMISTMQGAMVCAQLPVGGYLGCIFPPPVAKMQQRATFTAASPNSNG